MRTVLTMLMGCATSPPDSQPSASDVQRVARPTGAWRGWLEVPGGELPFGLELTDGVTILNGPERIPADGASFEPPRLEMSIHRYDATVRANLDATGDRLDGVYRRRRGPQEMASIPFHAVRGELPRFAPGPPPTVDVSGRWSVRFDSEEEPAVGVFEQHADGTVVGTFLTAVGDYRWLAGDVTGDTLRLSVFDGAHAFLFIARLTAEGLVGDFWSGTWWHETWTATRDDAAALPDPMTLTASTDVPLASIRFPDLDGNLRALSDPAFRGRARILEIFGTWCPNCNDATRYLVELDQRYRDRGLSILGLACELTGDLHRDTRQVKRYAAIHEATWPMLIAGLADKEQASKALPLLDKVRAYPTTVFLDADDRVRAVYTGFSGPATGDAHQELRARFEGLIEELLA